MVFSNANRLHESDTGSLIIQDMIMRYKGL